jgi:hypothetical protein
LIKKKYNEKIKLKNNTHTGMHTPHMSLKSYSGDELGATKFTNFSLLSLFMIYHDVLLELSLCRISATQTIRLNNFFSAPFLLCLDLNHPSELPII